MFTRILVPLDGSNNAERALPYARALARTLEIPVTLITVIETAADFFPKKLRDLDTLIQESMKGSEEYLEKVSRTFAEASVQYTVEKGKAEEAIIINAAADNGTLITMVSHGRSGVGRWLLGSVAEKVVHGANNAVLVVRANQEMTSEGEAAPNSIIVPLDGSNQAESVLLYVVELARAFHAKVTLLRAYSLKQIIFSFEQYHPDLDGLKDALRWEAKTYLDEKVAELNSRGLVDVFCSATEGDAPETIIEMGKGAPRTLIAMSTHGGSMIKHWVLGSVAEKVLRHANNAVLVIRT
ncbi:MAG: universal stress protein [Candidatus Binatia bacterium]